jgi:hypothetical protein
VRFHRRLVAVLAGSVAWLTALPVLAATLTRGPYLQLPGERSITIRWSTDEAALCAVSIRPLAGTPRVVNGSFDSACAIVVTDLEPGEHYTYFPLANGTPVAEDSVFRTDHPTMPFSFLVFGDSGSGGTRQYAVARIASRAAPPDFVLHTGDIVYEHGEATHYDRKFFRPYREILRRLVLWPALGNHDLHADDGAAWLAMFDTPANNPEGSERYYSFTHGNALVVVLDSNEETGPGSQQRTFLEQQLATSTATWKFLVFHESIYSSGRQHGSDLDKRANLIPVLDAAGADLVFMGNEHDYERTHALVGDQLAPPGTGTVYITSGAGGHSLHGAGTSFFTAYSESVFHLVRVAIDGGTLRAQMIREDGWIGDAVTLVKGAPGPEPRCGDGLVNAPGEICDGADLFACAGQCADDCTCLPACGDGARNAVDETCDGADDTACPGFCRTDCSCGDSSRFVELEAVADTYLKMGVDLGDYGASSKLEIDLAPPSIAYFKFDLAGVTAPTVRGTLVLDASNPSYDPGTVYPVPNSSWLEGIGDGTAPGTPPLGLRWADVDSNADGEIDSHDQSPYRPDFLARLDGLTEMPDESLVADVTAAVQGRAQVVSFAVRSDATDGVTYASREAAEHKRPRLRLELGDPPPTTTSTTSTTWPSVTTTTTTSSTSTSTTTTTVTTPAPPTDRCETDVDSLAAVGCGLARLLAELEATVVPDRLRRSLQSKLRRTERAHGLAVGRCAAGNLPGSRAQLRVAERALKGLHQRLGSRNAGRSIDGTRRLALWRAARDLEGQVGSLRSGLYCRP